MGEPGARAARSMQRRQVVEGHRRCGRSRAPSPARRPRRAAADVDVIALDHVLAASTLVAEQADVADVVLGAGVRAAGEVDVDRLIERDARLEVVGESAARASWCSAAANLQPALPVQATRPPRMLRSRSMPRPSASIAALPTADVARRRCRRSAGSARRSAGSCRCRSARRSRRGRASARDGHPADRQHDADVVQARLLLRMDADVAVLVGRRPRLALARSGTRAGAWPQLLLDLGDERRRSPMRSSTYFSRAFLRSVRSPCSMKTRTMAAATGDALVGRQQDARVAGEILVAGDAAELQAEIDAGSDCRPSTWHGGEADVVGVLQRADTRRRRRRRC